MFGGLIDRVHDLLLCGVDPSLVDLSTCLSHLRRSEEEQLKRDDNDDDYDEDQLDNSDEDDHIADEDEYQCEYQEIVGLLKAASFPWKPSQHAFLFGPGFKSCIASLCLVKVS